MTTMTAPPSSRLKPETIAKLTDRELERELTIAAIRSHRHERYELLLGERRRRTHNAA
ncbi:MAG: hypothetical protein ACXVQZ_04835 [Gaiellaceae bacterium]